jgi:hypothetical protein
MLGLVILIGIFVWDNVLLLMGIILFVTLILLQWYMYGVCLITPIENALSGNTTSSFISDYLDSILSKNGTDVVWILAPFVLIATCLYKIYHLKTTCKAR